MDDNPYAPPQTVDFKADPLPRICVDGDCVVASSGTQLPARCVITNEPTEPGDLRRARFEWAPSFRLVLRHDQCHLTYSISQRIRSQRNRIQAVTAVLGLAGLALIFAEMAIPGVAILGIAIVFQIVILRPHDSLKCERASEGHFWISGFGDEFLESCRQEFGEGSSGAPESTGM